MIVAESDKLRLELKILVAESFIHHCLYTLGVAICLVIVTAMRSRNLLTNGIELVAFSTLFLLIFFLAMGFMVYPLVLEWIIQGKEDRVVECCRWKLFRYLLMLHRRDAMKNLLERLRFIKEDSLSN